MIGTTNKLARVFFSFSTTPVKLHYQSVSSPDVDRNPNLLLIHGVLGYGALYKHIATNPAIQKRFNSFYVDLRNHGQSPWTDVNTYPSMAEDVKKWLDEQALINPITIVGHSMGARVLVELTRKYPELARNVKRIVFVDACTHSYEGFGFVKKSQDFLNLLKQLDLNKPQDELFKDIDSISSNPVQSSSIKLNIDLEKKNFKFNLNTIDKQYMKMISYQCRQTDWEGEVVVLKALKSQYITDHSKSEFRRLYKNLKHMWDVDCYHNIHLEKPYQVIKAINIQ